MNKKHSLAVIAVLVFTVNISLSCLSITFTQASNDDEPFTLNHRLHVKKSFVWVMGEIINNLGVSVKNVQIRVTFYDNNQHVMKESSVMVWLTVLLPQRRGPFIIAVDEKEVEGFANYAVEVEDYEQCEDKPVGLAIIWSKLWSRTNISVTVKGAVKNQGSKQTNFLLVIVYFYDTKGLLALESTTLILDEGLPPGGAKEFDIRSTFVNKSSSLVKCVLTAESAGSPDETQFAAYAITQENVIDLIQPMPDQNVIAIIVIVSLGIVTIIVIKKRKRKPRHAKTRILSKRFSKSRLVCESDKLLCDPTKFCLIRFVSDLGNKV